MLTIADNGCGFDAARVGRGGLGLQSMRERATEVGGDLQIEAAEGGGTVVRVTTPLDEKDEREKQAAAGA